MAYSSWIDGRSVPRAALFGFLVATLDASGAVAQSRNAVVGPTCPEQEARIAMAVDLRRQGADRAALEVFMAVRARCAIPRVIAQIGLAEHALGLWVDAARDLRQALANRSDPWIEARHAVLEQAMGAVRGHLVAFAPTSDVADAEVTLDGNVIGRLPLPEPILTTGGPHELIVRAPGRATLRRHLALVEGTTFTEPLSVPPEGSALPESGVRPDVAPVTVIVSPPVMRADRPPSRVMFYTGWTLVGLAVAAGVVGAVELGVSLDESARTRDATPSSGEPYGSWARFNRDNDADSRLSVSQTCELARVTPGNDASAAAGLCDEASTRTALAIGFGAASAVLAGVGVAFLVVAPRARTTPLTLRPSFSPQGGTLSVGVRF